MAGARPPGAALLAAVAHATGRQPREPLYQLYHVLNHFNLFGGGYASQAVLLTQRVLIGR
jgi:fructosamine-3-kinase